VPQNPIFPGRGGTPLQPQDFYVQSYTLIQTPVDDRVNVFRGPLRGLPPQPFPVNSYQSWTWSRVHLYPTTTLLDQPRQQDWPLPTPPSRLDQTWTAWYNLNLIAQDVLPSGEQVYVRPELGPRPIEQTWTWRYNPNLVGKDQLPTGEQNYDLVLSQRPPEQVQLHSWQWFYNLNLIAQDQLPSGEQRTDLVPSQRPPEQIQLHSWSWWYNLNLIGRDRLPTGAQSFERTPIAFPRLDQTWTWSYNVNLVSQDQMLAGRQVYDRLQLPPPPALTWLQTLNQNLIVITNPFVQSDWPLPTPRSRLDQTWTWNYNLNLIGQDQLPTGTRSFDRPILPIPAALTWIDAVKYNLIAKPFAQYDWPLPTPSYRLDQTWAKSYNLNLIGQDQLPAGARHTDLAPRDYLRLFQTWVLPFNLPLTQAPPDINAQARQRDWPLPTPQWRLDQSWTSSYNKNLIGQDQLPTGIQKFDRPEIGPAPIPQTWIQTPKQPAAPFAETDWPLPTQPFRLDQTWTRSYNPNLVGQDRLPTGKQSTALAPSILVPPDQIQLRSWQWFFNPNLTGQDRLPVGSRSWDLAPRAPQQSAPSWTASYNRNLVAQDQMIVGDRVYDLAPRGFPQLLQTWIQQVNIALLQLPGPLGLVSNQYDWPNPILRVPAARSWTASYNLDLIGTDRLPVGTRVFDRPTLRVPPAESWAASYNRNLIGKDRLPFRQSDWPTPRDYSRLPSYGFERFEILKAPVQSPFTNDTGIPGWRFLEPWRLASPDLWSIAVGLANILPPFVPPPIPPPPVGYESQVGVWHPKQGVHGRTGKRYRIYHVTDSGKLTSLDE
jgi:hypothetical protein